MPVPQSKLEKYSTLLPIISDALMRLHLSSETEDKVSNDSSSRETVTVVNQELYYDEAGQPIESIEQGAWYSKKIHTIQLIIMTLESLHTYIMDNMESMQTFQFGSLDDLFSEFPTATGLDYDNGRNDDDDDEDDYLANAYLIETSHQAIAEHYGPDLIDNQEMAKNGVWDVHTEVGFESREPWIEVYQAYSTYLLNSLLSWRVELIDAIANNDNKKQDALNSQIRQVWLGLGETPDNPNLLLKQLKKIKDLQSETSPLVAHNFIWKIQPQAPEIIELYLSRVGLTNLNLESELLSVRLPNDEVMEHQDGLVALSSELGIESEKIFHFLSIWQKAINQQKQAQQAGFANEYGEMAHQIVTNYLQKNHDILWLVAHYFFEKYRQTILDSSAPIIAATLISSTIEDWQLGDARIHSTSTGNKNLHKPAWNTLNATITLISLIQTLTVGSSNR